MNKKSSICDLLIKRQMGNFTKIDFDDLRNKASFLADTQLVRNQHINVSFFECATNFLREIREIGKNFCHQNWR